MSPQWDNLRESFELILKGYGLPSEKTKARFIAQGYKDCDKHHIVNDAATLRAFSIRIISSAASYHKLRIF